MLYIDFNLLTLDSTYLIILSSKKKAVLERNLHQSAVFFSDQPFLLAFNIPMLVVK